MSSHSQVLVADAFVAGSLQQAIFANDEGYGIIDGPEAEPRAARANDMGVDLQLILRVFDK